MRHRLAVSLLLAATLAACGDNERLGPGGAPDAMPPDAPLAPCGIEEPGTRCHGATILEQCNGTQIVQTDCSATPGTLCGADPTSARGSACVAPGDPCGGTPVNGVCDGDVLTFCGSSTQKLHVLDCTTDGSTCATHAGVSQCETACTAAGVTVGGQCLGGTAYTHCAFHEGQFHVDTVTCPAGTTCGQDRETGFSACLPPTACTSVGPEGRCAGTVLTSCSAGAPAVVDCATSGRVCAFAGDGVGYACVAQGTVGARTVSGLVQYEDRPPQTNGGLGAIGLLPVRGAAVAVVDDTTGAVLTSAVTADDGTYALHYDAAPGAHAHVLVAATSARATRPIRLIRSDGRTHGFGGASFTVPAASSTPTTADVRITESSGEAEAFNLFDQLVTGMDFDVAHFPGLLPPPLFAAWERGSLDGTYFRSDVVGIFLVGGIDDDDGYDDAVVLHEFGHYTEFAFGRFENVGGMHFMKVPSPPPLAWSEGWATYVSSAVRDNPFYMDSNGGGGVVYDIDGVTVVPMPAGPMSQNIAEDTVSEILWDVTDGGATDDDPVALGAGPVFDVVNLYMRSAAFVDRGAPRGDLVDWLDGFFLRHGLANCAGLRFIVQTTRSFPYDFAGPGGTCPP